MGRSTPYDDSFRTLLTDCPKLVIPLVNEMFSETYDTKDAVTLYQNEHFLPDEEERISDSNFSIGADKGKRYNIECQSNRDGSIVIRLFEYGAQVAQENAEIDDGRTTFRFPMEQSNEELEEMIKAYHDIFARLGELVRRGELTEYERQSIRSMCKRVALALAGRYEKVRKGVEAVMGGKVLEYEAKDILREGIKTGEERGKKIGEEIGKEEGTLMTLVRGVRRKLEKNKTPETAAEELEQEISCVLLVMGMIREHPEESDDAIVRRLMEDGK